MAMNGWVEQNWGGARVVADLRTGRYAVRLPGFALTGCEARVRRQDGAEERVVWQQARAARGTLRLTGGSAAGRWTLTFSGHTNGRGVGGVRVGMTGRPARGVRVAELIPLFAVRVPADHLLTQGRSAGGCRAIPLPADGEKPFESWHHTMVTRAGVTLQISRPLRQDQPSSARGEMRGRALRNLRVVTPVAGGAPRAESVSLMADRDGQGLMEAWAEEQREASPAPPAPGAGWNSWDYYRWTVTEEAVLRNAAFIAADPVLRRHVKRIIVDDGWPYCYGEWDANPLFPHGMKWLAGKLLKMGFEPGVWMAPGVVEPHARIAQWDPDMLARGLSGEPCLAFACMERFGFVLDPTVPKTRRWLHDLFDRYAGMGFRYFKLDFLRQTLNAPVFADPRVPRGKLVRLLVETARAAVGRRARIMGCGYDFMAGTAFVDEVRTSSDIHARWDSVKANAVSIAARGWAHGRLWGNDPDFALARGPETSADSDLTRLRACLVFVKPAMPTAPMEPFVLATMTAAEARTLLSLVLISGGAVNLSDDLTRLNRLGLDLVRRTVAAERGAAGVPLDLFASRRPAYWVQALTNGRRALLVNWEDRPRTLTLDLAPAGLPAGSAVDFWTGEPIPLPRGRLTANLAPHDCRLAELRA